MEINVAKIAKWLAVGVVSAGLAVGLVFLLCWGTVAFYNAFLERDYKTERLAKDMVRDLRYLANYCPYSNAVPSSEVCQTKYSSLENTCKGTVAPQLRDFCQDWEVITYVNANGSPYMIKLAQDIEHWLDRQ